MTTILVDIGRGSIRFALANSVGVISDYSRLPLVKRTPNDRLLPLIREWAEAAPRKIDFASTSVAIAAPGPFHGEEFKPDFEGAGFTLPELREAFRGRPLVVHDVIAGALSIPLLAEADQVIVREGESTPTAEDAPVVYIQTGIGLGVSALIPMAEGPALPFSGEGGSSTLAPDLLSDDEQLAYERIFQRHHKDKRNLWKYPSAQHILSAWTLPFIYGALDRSDPPESPGFVTARYIEGDDIIAYRSMSVYAGFLGAFAGDMALAFRAYGGVYIGGPLPPLLRPDDLEVFHRRFASRGSAEAQMTKISIRFVTNEYNALRGLNSILGMGR